MDITPDLWVMRDPPISIEEWRAFVASRTDFESVGEVHGVTSAGQPVTLPESAFHWWLGHSDGQPVPVSYTPNGVHFSSGDLESRALADHLAAIVGGVVHEG